jgi:shikimate kinase
MTDTPAPRRDLSSTRSNVPVCGVFLVGFMGAGKTSVGKALAESLGWSFVDLDHAVESREGASVPEIFQQHGEQGFRQREQQALEALVDQLSSSNPTIVALGGGAYVQPENAKLLRSAGTITVFLDTPVDELWQRCCEPGEPERPLRTDPVAFRALHEKRRVNYIQSDVRVETAGKPIRQVAQEVIERLNLRCQ